MRAIYRKPIRFALALILAAAVSLIAAGVLVLVAHNEAQDRLDLEDEPTK